MINNTGLILSASWWGNGTMRTKFAYLIRQEFLRVAGYAL